VIATADMLVWLARAREDNQFFVAVFNRSGKDQSVRYEWRNLGLVKNEYKLRDLWQHRDLAPAPALSVQLAPHSSLLYRLAP